MWRLGGEKAFDTLGQFPGLWGIDYDPTNDMVFAADAVYGVQMFEAYSMGADADGHHLGAFEQDGMRVPQDVKVDTLGNVYVAGETLLRFVEEDVAAHPSSVGLFGAQGRVWRAGFR
ncbi:MAG: hypothetical protein KKD28_07175 [Chloroflexi bacterium]|nr:hypothetical protein [Chloroflexota bacterium]MBU1661238.1 hypothetical protein [Chloroflexota bacterium]